MGTSPSTHKLNKAKVIFYGSFYFQALCNAVKLQLYDLIFFVCVFIFFLSDLLGDSGEEAKPW